MKVQPFVDTLESHELGERRHREMNEHGETLEDEIRLGEDIQQSHEK